MDLAVSLIPYAIITVLTVIPAWRLFGRIGMSRYWVVLTLAAPIGVVIILWLVAYGRWDQSRTVSVFD